MTDGERGTMVLQLEKTVSGTTTSFKPTAAPFVPSGSLNLSRPGSASTMAVHAAPFVPGRTMYGAAAEFVPRRPSSATSTFTPNAAAAPFMMPDLPQARAGGTDGAGPSMSPVRLPEGDDLFGLGMTAFVPGDAPGAGTGTGQQPSDLSLHALALQQSSPAHRDVVQQQQQQQPDGGLGFGPADGRRPPSAGSGSAGTLSSPTRRTPYVGSMQPRPQRGRGGLPFGAPADRGTPTVSPVHGRGGAAGFERGRGARMRGGRRGGYAGSAGPGRAQLWQRFVSESLRNEITQRQYMVAAELDPEADAELGLPDMVGQYHTIYPLEDVAQAAAQQSAALGVRTLLLKGISSADGSAYALRRIDPRQVMAGAENLIAAREAVDAWQPLAGHPNVVVPRAAFVNSDVGGAAALYLAHDYHPGAATMEQMHIQPTDTGSGLTHNAATEDQLWSYLVQLASALRVAHSAGLACRAASLAPSKGQDQVQRAELNANVQEGDNIRGHSRVMADFVDHMAPQVLAFSSGRLRIGSLGFVDALSRPIGGAEELRLLQREDMQSVGRLILSLACAGLGGAPSLELCMAHFSVDLTRLVGALLTASDVGGLADWRGLAAALGERVFMEQDSQQLYADALAGELGRELENGRLLRVLVKLSTVTERPEHDSDPQWSETGDRYLLKLFRDFVFHQVTEDGAPLLDWGLVAEALTKLDAGVPEKVLLLSRDEMSMLVVSYGDVKRCLEAAWSELQSKGSAARAAARNHILF